MERTHDHRVPPILSLLPAVLAGLASVAIGAQLGDTGAKWKVLTAFALLVPVAATIHGRLREMLVFFWPISLTYNRQFFSFGSSNGTQGPYWVLGDIFLGLLLVLWLYEAATAKRVTSPRPNPVWPWYLPFAAACLFSVPGADRPDWALFEMLRVLRFAIIIWYVRRNFGPREWWAMLGGMASAMAIQSVIGLKEVITGHPGVFGSEVAQGVGQFENVFSQESFYGSVRATGTMNHPPNLACYLVMVIPICFCVALMARRRNVRIAALMLFAIGCMGLGCTLSRWPFVLAALEVVVAFGAAVHFRAVSFRQASGILLVAIVVGLVALVPFREKILNRATGDFSESVQQRREGSEAAISMASESAIFGIGLNNSKLHMLKYLPELDWAVGNEDFLIASNIRSIAALGNGFLFVTVETGVVGTLTFALFLAGLGVFSKRALAGTEGVVRGAVLGLVLALCAVLLQDLIDFSLWVDPILYTVAIMTAMLSIAPSLFPRDRAAVAREAA
jgi:hypothetical protein